MEEVPENLMEPEIGHNRLQKLYLPPTSEIAPGSSIAVGRVMPPTRSGRHMSCVQPELCPNNNSQYSQLSESNDIPTRFSYGATPCPKRCSCRVTKAPQEGTSSTSGSDHIALEVRQSLLHRGFNGLAAALYLAHEHRALHGSDAEVCHVLRAGVLGKLSLCFLSQEKGSEVALDNFEDETEVLSN